MIASYAGEALPGEWISDRDAYSSGTAPSTGAQVVYEVAEPTVYNLTPVQIKMLLGENNVWADCGDTDVEYVASTGLYIQNLIARPDDDMTADRNIENGKYFMAAGRLFISTTAIAQGEIIAPGTNCTETNIADALNIINA